MVYKARITINETELSSIGNVIVRFTKENFYYDVDYDNNSVTIEFWIPDRMKKSSNELKKYVDTIKEMELRFTTFIEIE